MNLFVLVLVVVACCLIVDDWMDRILSMMLLLRLLQCATEVVPTNWGLPIALVNPKCYTI
jgi:hypothetical protein